MKICLLTPELPPFSYGGIGNYVEALASGLAQRGHDIVVTGYQLHPQDIVQHEWGRSISVTWQGRFIWRLKVGALLSAALALRNLFQTLREGFDIVEVPNWAGHAFLLPRLPCPLIARVSTPHVDTLVQKRTLADHAIHMAEKRVCRRASLVIAHSFAMAKKAACLYGVEQNTTVIPLGIAPGKVPLFSPNETVDLLFVGRAEHRKGIDVFLLALDELLEKEPKLNVTFVGTKLEGFVRDKPHLLAIFTRLKSKCPTRFREVGFINEAKKKQLFQQADWAIIPSRFESFGIVAIEAMREGTPIIGSRGSGIEEIAGLTPTSLLVEPGDCDSLVKALKEALSRGSDYKAAIMDSIRHTFLSRFTAEAMVTATEKVYRDKCKETRPKAWQSVTCRHNR